jgi:hypothetical protein
MPTTYPQRLGATLKNAAARLLNPNGTRKVAHLYEVIDEARYRILNSEQKKRYTRHPEFNSLYKLISNDNSNNAPVAKTAAAPTLPYKPYNIDKIRKDHSSVKSVKNRGYGHGLIETLTDLDTLCWETVETRNSGPRYLGKYLGQITLNPFTTHCYFEKEGPVENEKFMVTDCQAGGRRNKRLTRKSHRYRSRSLGKTRKV